MIDVAYWNFAALEGLRSDDRLRVVSRDAAAVLFRLVLVARGDAMVPYLNHHTGPASVAAYDLRECDLEARGAALRAVKELGDVGLIELDDRLRVIRLRLHEGLLSREARAAEPSAAAAPSARRVPPSSDRDRARARKLKHHFNHRTGPFRALDLASEVSWESWSTSPEGVEFLTRNDPRNEAGTTRNDPRNEAGTTRNDPGTTLSPTPPLQKGNQRETEGNQRGNTEGERARERNGNDPRNGNGNDPENGTGTTPGTTCSRSSDSGAPAPLSLVPPTPKADPIAEVFAHWRKAMGKTDRTVLDAKRRALIAKALKSYDIEDLLRAVDGYAASPWHRGENDRRQAYDGLDLILRDAEHIEKGWLLFDQHGAPALEAAAEEQPEDMWEAGLRDLAALNKARAQRAQEVARG